MPHLLLVEDNQDLGAILAQYLQEHNFAVTWCEDGEKGLQAFRENNFDLCILDVMMPVKDGFTLAGEIHSLNDTIPFIFLTARNKREDRIKGLKLLADDYITKPFDPEELVLRIQTILRRVQEQNLPVIIQIGKYSFDYNNLTLANSDIHHKLTLQEAKLLRYLYQHRNNLIRREVLLKAIWGKDDYFLGRSMDVFITRLRKYLKNDTKIQIESTRGVGITFHLNG
jgi:DNA-binding response OmpR family regulator